MKEKLKEMKESTRSVMKKTVFAIEQCSLLLEKKRMKAMTVLDPWWLVW